MDGFGEESNPNPIEEWCMNVAKQECTQRGVAIPRVRFRYSKARTKQGYYWRDVWYNESHITLAEQGHKVRCRPDYCEAHQSYDLCDPLWQVAVADYDRRPKEARKYSSGHAHSHTNPSRTRPNISVTFGTDDQDRKLVFLHELGHWLGVDTDWHNKAFWRRAYNLYDKYGIDRTYYLWRETSYRKAAGKVAAETGRVNGDEH